MPFLPDRRNAGTQRVLTPGTGAAIGRCLAWGWRVFS